MNSVTYAAASSIAPVDADATAAMSFSNVNWNLHSSLNNALNGWCGTRFNEDSGASVKSSGNFVLRTCSAPDIILESIPAGTTHSISAASCVGNLLTYTIGSNSFGANGQIRVTGVSPSGLNGTYSVVSATSTTVSVVNDACPLTYSSGGTNALVYGPPSFISTASVLSDGAVGDLQLRSDGGKIAQGFAGKTMSAWLPGYLQFYDLAGTTPKAYIGSAASVGSNWTTDDLQIRSDGTAIRFSFNGTEAQYMPNPGGLVFDSGVTTPTGGAGTVGLGATTQSAGTGNCPTTVTINGSASAPAGCLVITVGGTGRSVPFF
jgi:hypothetical protein